MGGVSNGIAALLIAVYLAGVVRQGNAETLLVYVADDRLFLYWLIALVLVHEIVIRTGQMGGSIALLLAIALVLNIGPKVFPAVDKYIGEVVKK